MVRKLLALALLLAAYPRSAWAVPSVPWAMAAMVNSVDGNHTCVGTIPGGKSAAVGDELVWFGALGAQTQTITAPASAGVTWSSAHCFNAGGGEEGCVFGGQVTSLQAAATTYTFTDTTANNLGFCDLLDVAGTNNTIDSTHGTQGTGGGTTMTMTSSQSVANDMVVAFIYNYNVTQITSLTFGTGWTGTPTAVNNLYTPGAVAAADFYNVQTSSGSPGLVVNWGTTTWMDYVNISIQPAGAAPSPVGFFAPGMP